MNVLTLNLRTCEVRGRKPSAKAIAYASALLVVFGHAMTAKREPRRVGSHRRRP